MDKDLFTSESVGRGHPDKLCDQISDLILDEYIKQDKTSKVAVEVMATGNYVFIAGEVSSKGTVDVKEVAKKLLVELGYFEHNGKQTIIISDIKQQSPDISLGIELQNGDIGAGDQGFVFGYASKETSEYMPLPIILAHRLVQKAEELRISGKFKNSGPDMKSQVTVDYADSKKIKIDTVLMSIQHTENYNEKEFKDFIKNKIIIPVLKEYQYKKAEKILINPTGNFVVGGPWGDTGITGRKIIVDTYGGIAHHGGGSFSGKDSTKVDRSAAYAARWMAKNIVAAGLANKIEIQIAYAIGISKPISVSFRTFESLGEKNKEIINEIINVSNIFDLTPKGIIKNLNLRNPIYFKTSYFGHFGRKDIEFPWEKTDKVAEIKKFVKKNV